MSGKKVGNVWDWFHNLFRKKTKPSPLVIDPTPKPPPLPRIALCTTAGNRIDHIKLTLPKNIADNIDYPNAVHVLLDYSSTDGLWNYIWETFQPEIKSGRLVYYYIQGMPYFKMSHAKNVAARCGILEGGTILANVDADNYTGKGFATYIAQKFKEAEIDQESIYLRARESHTGPGRNVADRMPWGCGGRIVCSMEAFLQAGGYDETFVHWSPDDKDFSRRLTRIGYIRHGIRHEFLTSIEHGDEYRFDPKIPGSPKEMKETAKLFQLEGRGHISIVNYGSIGMGTVYRNFDAGRPIVLQQLPTRIFGIGLHKTATTSLAAALDILAYSASHWESPLWARNIYNEMGWWNNSPTLEAYYSIIDIPIAILYQKLDKHYPGSKFILTIRDEESWIKSVEAHWKLYYDTSWAEDENVSHEMHTRVYGQKEFDREIFLQHYRQHNADVLEYFKNRPHDLLVMDMSKGAGWKELCTFLGKAIPDCPYPHEFVTVLPEFNPSYPQPPCDPN